MKLADAIVEMIEKDLHPSLENKIIIPKLDHNLCVNIIEYAGKKPSTGFGGYKRKLECDRITNALNKDDRFEQFTHITGCKGFEYIDEKQGDINDKSIKTKNKRN